MSVTVERFVLDHYRALAGDENLNGAIINLLSGPAYTLFDGREILAVGGVRVQGIGQAWTLLGPGAVERPRTIVQTARAVLDDAIAAERLCRVYAEATVDKDKWFKILGFHRQNNLFVR